MMPFVTMMKKHGWVEIEKLQASDKDQKSAKPQDMAAEKSKRQMVNITTFNGNDPIRSSTERWQWVDIKPKPKHQTKPGTLYETDEFQARPYGMKVHKILKNRELEAVAHEMEENREPAEQTATETGQAKEGVVIEDPDEEWEMI
jgi:hypothetical protein